MFRDRPAGCIKWRPTFGDSPFGIHRDGPARTGGTNQGAAVFNCPENRMGSVLITFQGCVGPVIIAHVDEYLGSRQDEAAKVVGEDILETDGRGESELRRLKKPQQ